MPLHPVVDRFTVLPALDPASLLIFAAAFLAAGILTLRRPAYGAVLLVAVPPFTFEHLILGTTLSIPKMVLLGTVCGLLGRRDAVTQLRRVRLPLCGFAAIIGAIVLTLVVAPYRGEVAREAFKWIEYALFFATASVAFGVDPDSTVVRRGFTVAICAVCATAFAELFTGAASGIWVNGTSIPRIAGLLEGPNQFAGYLEIAIAFLVAQQAAYPRRSTAVVLAVAVAALVLTFSRAALIGIGVIAVITFIVRGRATLRAMPGALAGIIAGAAVTVEAIRSLRQFALSDFALRASDSTGAGAGGVGSRSELWRAAIALFRRHPVLGAGAGNYERRLSEVGLYGVRTHANSWYLQALAEGGIVLFASTLFFIFSIAASLIPRMKTSAWGLAATAAFAALCIHQIADYLVFYPKVAEPLFVLCAIGCVAPPEPCD